MEHFSFYAHENAALHDIYAHLCKASMSAFAAIFLVPKPLFRSVLRAGNVARVSFVSTTMSGEHYKGYTLKHADTFLSHVNNNR